MRVFEFYSQPATLASEISDRFSRPRFEPLKPSCSHADPQKRPVTRRLGLAAKIGDHRSLKTASNRENLLGYVSVLDNYKYLDFI